MHTRARGLVYPEKHIDWPVDDHPAFCDGVEERGIRMCPFTSRKAEAGEEAQGCGIGGRGWRWRETRKKIRISCVKNSKTACGSCS
jgi:hypothetical protein